MMDIFAKKKTKKNKKTKKQKNKFLIPKNLQNALTINIFT